MSTRKLFPSATSDAWQRGSEPKMQRCAQTRCAHRAGRGPLRGLVRDWAGRDWGGPAQTPYIVVVANEVQRSNPYVFPEFPFALERNRRFVIENSEFLK